MGKTKLDETHIFKISIKIRLCRVLVTIEPGRSLQQFVITNCVERFYWLPVREISCNRSSVGSFFVVRISLACPMGNIT